MSFVKYGYNQATGVQRVVDGSVDWLALNKQFMEQVYVQKRRGTRVEAHTLYTQLQACHLRGLLPGYDFLFEMPEEDGDEWVFKTICACVKGSAIHPVEEYPPLSIKESFDRVREERKQRKAESKKKKAV